MQQGRIGSAVLGVALVGLWAWLLADAGRLVPEVDRVDRQPAHAGARRAAPDRVAPRRAAMGSRPVPTDGPSADRGAPAAGEFPRRVASYRIRARLDPAAHTVSGQLALTWQNPSAKPAEWLPFHLYLNAFRHRGTIFLREGRLDGRRLPEVSGGWGGIAVSAVRVNGAPASAAPRADGTVLRVRPQAPVPGHGRAEVTLRFVAHLPKLRARTGYAGDFHFVAQWFPKLGVRADRGAWHCPPFHLLSEFFADFGRYEVTLEVPRGFDVEASGERVRTERTAAGGLRAHYVADPVHDFVWLAAPGLRRHRQRQGRVTVQVVTVGDGVDAVTARRHLAVMAATLARLTRWYAPYPYPVLTGVLVPEDAEPAGGMEYPTLFTSHADHPPLLERFGALSTTVHELVHQYFYGLLASNEHDEPWLDEGFTTYVTGLVMDDLYGADRSVFELGPLRLGYFDLARFWVRRSPPLDPVRLPAPRYASIRSYGATVYGRTALVLRTLERQIGARAMRALMADYVRRYRLRHPTGDDFLGVVDRHVPDPRLRRFVRQALASTDRLDYAVLAVRPVRMPPWAGREDTEADRAARARYEAERRRAPYRNRVLLFRRGGLQIPVTVQVRFADGSVRRVGWDGQARYHWLELPGKSPVVAAVVDPDGTLALEHAVIDNGRATGRDLRPARRIAGRLLALLQITQGMVGL